MPPRQRASTTTAKPRPKKRPAPPPPINNRGWQQHKTPRYDRHGRPVAKQPWSLQRVGSLFSGRKAKAPTTRTKGQTASTRVTHRVRSIQRHSRLGRRRGAIFSMLTVGFAAVALTAAAIEFTSWSLAADMFAVAELISAGTSWWFGEAPLTGQRATSGPAPAAGKPGNGKPTGGASGCSPACMHGSPANAAKCTCVCGGRMHGSARGGATPGTSKPKPRTRKPPTKPPPATTTGPKSKTVPKPRPKPAGKTTP